MNQKEYAELSDKEKQIKVAELNGFTNIEVWEDSDSYHVLIGNHPSAIAKILVPDYLNDLNIMHKVVQALTKKQKWKYYSNMHLVCGWVRQVFDPEIGSVYATLSLIEATAAQRAEAYVLAMTAQEDEQDPTNASAKGNTDHGTQS